MVFAISKIRESSMVPGPLGILATNPSAEAPKSIAILASCIELMQQILTLGIIV
jgi:hypothetical protein